MPVRSIVYRFPDLERFGVLVRAVGEPELELGVPAGETVDDGEWVLAIFELGSGRKATSAAARAAMGEGGVRLVFEPRDWQRLAKFVDEEGDRLSRVPPAPSAVIGASGVSRPATSSATPSTISMPGPAQPSAEASSFTHVAPPPTPLAATSPSPDPPTPVVAPPPGYGPAAAPTPRAWGAASGDPAWPTFNDETMPAVKYERDVQPDTLVDESTLLSGGGRPSEAPPNRAVVRTVIGSARVLVVDDDEGIREVVSAMLEAVGLTVAQAPSAEDAQRLVYREPFDLLVLDWNLPKMTGIELCRILRQSSSTASIPVLFLTANASSQDMVQAFASGADDYVVKPFRAPELGARIFSLLRRARLST